jgi:hypothetical protein
MLTEFDSLCGALFFTIADTARFTACGSSPLTGRGSVKKIAQI